MDAIFQGLSNPQLGPLYALIAGVLTSASPCALAALPLVFAHMAGSTGKTRFVDLAAFISGLTLALTFVGVIAGAAGRSLILSAPWLRWVAGLAFIAGGAAYLGVFSRGATCDVPLAGSEPSPARSLGLPRPLAGVMMGALYGLSASPCSTPALFAILALVAGTGSITRGAVLLFFYSVGQSSLVAAAGLATAGFRGFVEGRGMRALEALRVLAGAVIVVFGIYLLVRPYL